MRYRPQLDALRGLFVSAVFLCHAQFLECGWVGVQAFFVLSGYLITDVLLGAKGNHPPAGRFFRDFYARRALRIFPVYFVYIAAVFALAGLGGPEWSGEIRAHTVDHAPWLLTYTYNFFRITDGGGSPFYGHLWSLSIEEQFYLLWPLCVFLLSRQRLLGFCKLLVVAGPLIRLAEMAWTNGMHPDASGDSARVIYFLTVSHFDAFALGALLNFRHEDALVGKLADAPARRVLLPVLLASVAMLLASRLGHFKFALDSLGWPIYLQHFQAQIWGYSVLNLVFFVVIAKSAQAGSLLDGPFFQRLGKVSYGFYIFHLPVIWIAANISGTERGSFTAYNLGVNVAAFAATWIIAELSFRFLESPALALKKHFDTGAIAAQAQSAA